MLLSIIMPIYNEEKFVRKVIEEVLSVVYPCDIEVVVVDDGSTDNSLNEVRSFKDSRIRVFHKSNGGKGSALRLGFSKARGDVFVVQDADLEYSPKDLPLLLKPILDKKTEVVFGNRFAFGYKGSLVNIVGNWFLSFVSSVLYGKISDMETCYKMFTRNVYNKIKPLSGEKFEIEPELFIKIRRAGFDIMELPINYSPRSVDEGKKIKVFDGVKAFWFLIKKRFEPKNI